MDIIPNRLAPTVSPVLPSFQWGMEPVSEELSVLHNRQGREEAGEELQRGLLLPRARQRQLQGVRQAKHTQQLPCAGKSCGQPKVEKPSLPAAEGRGQQKVFPSPTPTTSQGHRRRKDRQKAAHFSVLPARAKPLGTLQNMTPNR